MKCFILAAMLLCATGANAAEPVKIPEIEGPRAAYHQALVKIRAERDQQTAETKRTYAARLEALQKELAEANDAPAAEEVRKEAERVSKQSEPTAEERRKMTGLLLATRVAYEKACGPANIAAARREAAAHAAWERGLGELEAHLTQQRQFAKVAIVKAERRRVAEAKAAAIAAAEAKQGATPSTP